MAAPDGVLRIWESFQLTPKATGKGHSGAIRAVTVDSAVRIIATGGDDGRIGLWNVSGQLVAPLQPGHSGAVRGVAVLPQKEAVIASVAEDSTLRWWSLADPTAELCAGERQTPDAVVLDTRRGAGVTVAAGQVTRVDPAGSRTVLGRVGLLEDENVQSVAYSSSGSVALVLGQRDWKARVVVGTLDRPPRENPFARD